MTDEQPAPALPMIREDGTVQFPSFDVPQSSYVSDEARRFFVERFRDLPSWRDPDIVKTRENIDRTLLQPYMERARRRYPVEIEQRFFAGVRTDIVTPSKGVSDKNARRVLINLHGGGFELGNGVGGLVESIPIASVGNIKVVSVDYRLGPEHKFPAASEDVAAVYRELLKSHSPSDIGIYGCSAGGILAAMEMAWLEKARLAKPGAIGIFCAPASPVLAGDSAFFGPVLTGSPAPPLTTDPAALACAYLSDVDLSSPLVSPLSDPGVLSRFPPTLVISGTRDFAFSSAVHTHAQLIKAGIHDARLNVWEGMWHAFFYNADLPESREAYDVVVKFFDRHLGADRS